MKPTREQDRIIGSKSDTIKVRAFAGAGKTSTLVQYALANPRSRLLYLAFNKSVQMEAQSKFPSNVTSKTSHSIAFGAVGRHYASKLSGGIRPHQIMQLPEMKEILGHTQKNLRPLYSMRMIEAINRFTSTEDEYITEDHFVMSAPEKKSFPMDESIKIAQRYWDMMCDVKNDKVSMTHDGYLKLFLDSGKGFGNYDILLLDEGQDSNPVTMAMFNAQQCKKVMVGDSHQSIYQFRGAVNAMEEFDAQDDFILSQSFRFGDNVALAANLILHLKNEKNYLFGTNTIKDSIITEEEMRNTKNFAFLSRSNVGLFMEAVDNIKKGKSVHFLGGVEGYNFSMIEDAYKLSVKRPEEVKDPFLKQFETFEKLEEYAGESSDPEVGKLINCINLMRGDVPLLLGRVANLQTPIDKANVILSTIHKSKGLEFDYVRMDDAFSWDGDKTIGAEFNKAVEAVNNGMPSPFDERMLNAAYVAATRAKKGLSADYIDALSNYARTHVMEKYLNCKANHDLKDENIDNTIDQYLSAKVHQDLDAGTVSPDLMVKAKESVFAPEPIEEKAGERQEVSSSQLRRARRRTF